ncbi:MAG: AAA family ATPase [Candidatus Binataceae bacterium]
MSANIELMRADEDRAAAIGSSDQVRRWASQRNLPPDQTAVAELTLASTDWVTAIEGRASATKTTTVGAIRAFAEDQGYAVYGFAPTTRAVESLSEAGVAARTIASFPASQSVVTRAKQIWIIDESSLLPTRQVNQLLYKAREQSVQRIVFVGDQRQHHAIEAGRLIRVGRPAS